MQGGAMGDVFVCGAYLLNMSTAIVWVYTDNGLVIASDGRVLGHHHVISDDAQKVFFVPGENFVYATMGLSMMTTGSCSDVIFINDALDAQARDIQLDPRNQHNLGRCGELICADALRIIKSAKEKRILDDLFEEEFPIAGYPGFVLAHIFMWGYGFTGSSHVDIMLMHENQVPRLELRPLQANRTWNAYGSEKVYYALRDTKNRMFENYRIPAMAKDIGIRMDEGIEIAKNYIAACQSSEGLELDQKYCSGIGGNPQILTFTPKRGPEWVDGYRPREQVWKDEFRAKYLKSTI